MFMLCGFIHLPSFSAVEKRFRELVVSKTSEFAFECVLVFDLMGGDSKCDSAVNIFLGIWFFEIL